MLSIRKFGVEDDTDQFEPLTLTGLDVRADLNQRTWVALKEDPLFHEDITFYENQTIRTVVVRNWPDESFLYLVFLRLNTGNLPLSTQELRQALHPGPFTDYVDEFSADSASLQKALKLSAPDFRMRDVEILIRYFAFSEFISTYNGNLKRFLDSTSEHFNQAWSTQQGDIERIAKQCEYAIDRTIEIFELNAFRRWAAGHFEAPFNRAVFDIMTYYFSNTNTAIRAVSNSEGVIRAFKDLCDNNEDFSNSLQTTTKSINATFTRLREWGKSLREVLDIDIVIPASPVRRGRR